ncbi:hypothetical protein [Salinibacter ruber]|uniref:Uncharacterized protein n=1 Tax=Salinibacter ruber TaxID=146919 RepID=A0A9X2Z5S0_9BACT|nr:hypothetical protein [Salinibacter ruber]MCS3953193.1 hypothetical protein [Salinibacter ruber]
MGDSLRVIHIAPELPPTVGGVADYAAILSRRLVEVSKGAVQPVLVHAGNQVTDAIDVEFPVRDLSGQCSAAALAETIERLADEAGESAVVLLEYSGYGYATRGAPLWLLRGLRKACGNGGVPLTTIFHELYAMGPPWTSAFWASPLQRFVTARLARISAGIVTNRPSAVSWLQRYRVSEGIPVKVQPVFSNVGEPEVLPGFEKRSRQAVVFGGGGRKSLVYHEHQNVLQEFVDREGFSTILDIGPTVDSVPSEESWSRPLGILSEDEISDQLSNVSLGLLSYPGSRLGKSGVAAAFASHGVPFLLFDEETSPGDTNPYVDGRHFLRANALNEDDSRLSDKQLTEMSRSLRSLYQERLHSTHAARCFLDLIQKVVPTSAASTTSPHPE